tara:strand:- start:933 stop:1598 length:666 start_codon:yes stop_codon:yes gene_type:complete
MSSVSVLCRGLSLRYINDLPKSDVVVLVNSFGDELEKYTEIVEYINEAEIYLCTSGTAGELDTLHRFGFFEKFNPTRMIRPYLDEISKTHIHLQNSINLTDTFLSDAHKKYMYQIKNYKYPYTYPSSGIAALSYVVLDCDFNNINIIGLDFYETISNSSYYAAYDSNPLDTDWGKDGHMQEVVTSLVEDHPEKSFNMVSTAENHLDDVKTMKNMNFKKVGG